MATDIASTTDGSFVRMRRGDLPPPPVSTTLGGCITTVDLEAGTLESDYHAGEGFLNPAGQVQGGVLGAMLDDVTAFLVTATLAPGEHCATLNLNLSFLKPARAGALQGRSRLVRRGRGVCHVVGELLQDDRVVATATAVCTVARSR
jgi:uncharacterized protein (TIGR00369 family)